MGKAEQGPQVRVAPVGPPQKKRVSRERGCSPKRAPGPEPGPGRERRLGLCGECCFGCGDGFCCGCGYGCGCGHASGFGGAPGNPDPLQCRTTAAQ